MRKHDKTRQDKTFIIVILRVQFPPWHAVGNKTSVDLVGACQINSITHQILQIISKKQRKRKGEICVMNSKARKTNLFIATCEKAKFRISRFYF